jgi:hypothetical protein
VKATVDGVPVRVLDLSTMNARLEHEQPFPFEDPSLRLEWNRSEILLPFRVMRSEIVAHSMSGPIHHSGIDFIALDPLAVGLIASILQWAQQSR